MRKESRNNHHPKDTTGINLQLRRPEIEILRRAAARRLEQCRNAVGLETRISANARAYPARNCAAGLENCWPSPKSLIQ